MTFDVDHVLAEATTEELAALVCGSGSWHTTGIPRLGVPPVRLADGPHGLRVGEDLDYSEPSTCFPTAVGLGSSWNPALLKRVGEALGREATALGVDVVLGPGLNIKRSPRSSPTEHACGNSRIPTIPRDRVSGNRGVAAPRLSPLALECQRSSPTA